MPPPKRQPSADTAVQSTLLDLHEAITEVRAIAELVACLADGPDSIEPAVLGIVERLLHQLDEELRARYEQVRLVVVK